MSGPFRDSQHLVRAVLLLAGGLAVFFCVNALLVPDDFGEYGHFRAGALADNAARPIAFAGHAACEECHSDVVAARTGSKHGKVSCEICHGPQAAHADDPSAAKPPRPNGRELCLNCHERLLARPAGFPQVESKAHAGDDDCTACHPHHHPDLGGGR